MKQKVYIPQDIAQAGKDYLIERGYELKMGSDTTSETMCEEIADCDAVLLRTAPMTKELMLAGKKLKIIARHGAGYNNVDLSAAKEMGICVTNTPDATTETVADYTIGAIVAITRNMLLLSQSLQNGDFYYKNQKKGFGLSGKTLAIAGYGRIGAAVARKAHYAFDMNIIAYSPGITSRQLPDYVTPVTWETLLADTDILSLHMPYTIDNYHCISKTELDQMKKEAYLINCARGELVDEAAVINKLKSGALSGVFTDVFEQEPPSADHPFFNHERVIATPHMASNTKDCMTLIAVQAASQIDKVLSGREADWPVI